MSESSINQNAATLSRKEFANRLLNRLNGSGDFPHFTFDPLRYSFKTDDGETVKFADFYTEHLARYARDNKVNSDWIFEELRERLSHRDDLRPVASQAQSSPMESFGTVHSIGVIS